MKNKVLVKFIFPELEIEYDAFIPVNELVWKVTKLVVKAVSDLTNANLDVTIDYILMNKERGRVYKTNEIIIDTDIRNATELVIVSKNI